MAVTSDYSPSLFFLSPFFSFEEGKRERKTEVRLFLLPFS